MECVGECVTYTVITAQGRGQSASPFLFPAKYSPSICEEQVKMKSLSVKICRRERLKLGVAIPIYMVLEVEMRLEERNEALPLL